MAKSSEELILKHNPSWSAYSYKDDFQVSGFFFYDEKIPFARESSRGRLRACRAVGAALTEEQVERFNSDHKKLLEEITKDDHFNVIHRLDAHRMKVRG